MTNEVLVPRKTPRTKKPHYVPHSVLAQFADRDGRLWAYDLAEGRSFPINARDAAQERDFLAVPSLDGAESPGSHFETFFHGYESKAGSALEHIRSAITSGIMLAIDGLRRRALAEFIAVQHLRTPEARERALQLLGPLRRSLADAAGHAAARARDVGQVVNFDASWRNIDQAEERRIHADLLLSDSLLQLASDTLASHVWILGVNRTPATLYIADHPVALHNHAPRQGRGLGLKTHGVEVIVPLASWLQLSLFERTFLETERPELLLLDGLLAFALEQENVAFERSVQVFAARRFVYCREDDFALVRDMRARHPTLAQPTRARVEGHIFGEPVGQVR